VGGHDAPRGAQEAQPVADAEAQAVRRQVAAGYTEDNVKELRKETNREGMDGISPRYVQDKISNALVSEKSDGHINPFMVLNELEAGLRNHSLIATTRSASATAS
jgi:predicted Ser/Thr protein kinase